MSLKELMKNNKVLRAFGKRVNIHKEFAEEERMFAANYMETAQSQKAYEYKMLLIVHSIEKGMTMAARPFGEVKIGELRRLVSEYSEKKYSLETTAYQLSVSIIIKWVEFHEQRMWNSDFVQDTRKWFDQVCIDKIVETGIKVLSKKELLAPKNFNYGEFAYSRRAVRNFSETQLNDQDVLDSVKIALLAPTACNRQMVRIYRIVDEKKRNYMLNHIIGISGFTNDTVSIFVIAYDMASLNYYGERNQGYFNAGLIGMTFSNALHSKGIGSCFLQWSNTLHETTAVKQKLGIPDDVNIASILAAGYYSDESTIPLSTRKMPEEIYGEL
ncbi:Nitroreductase family protein [anaerobic digester metagenome]